MEHIVGCCCNWPALWEVNVVTWWGSTIVWDKFFVLWKVLHACKALVWQASNLEPCLGFMWKCCKQTHAMVSWKTRSRGTGGWLLCLEYLNFLSLKHVALYLSILQSQTVWWGLTCDGKCGKHVLRWPTLQPSNLAVLLSFGLMMSICNCFS
jgi:hypothetical protein